ncbi:MAG: enoyl-CoA hydratase/isomerase family protein [Deltaproteobacteria bacterium]|nr:enoyl-CoA hydratase/isomerase family protein [Deltaproteobacteria bacterium]
MSLNNPALRLQPADGDGIAILWIDCPGKKVNTLSVDLMPEFEAVYNAIAANAAIKGLVIASAKDTGFIAGADLDDLGQVSSAADAEKLSKGAQEGMNRLAALQIPTVAAIHGEALGGGLELALACKARVASEHRKTKLALPEVMLGLLPGAGGTVRLPKLVGLANALDMMLTGRNIRASKALKMGLVDRTVPPLQLLDAAKALARDLAHGRVEPKKKPPVKDEVQHFLLEGNPLGKMVVLREARKKVIKQTKGMYPAPLRILDVVDKGTYDAEAKGFGELLMTPQSAGLRHLFAAITALKKDDGPGTDSTRARPVQRVGMLGAGLMGAGIATVLADNGVEVRLKDRDHTAIAKALDYARTVYGKAKKKRVYGQAGVDERLARISGGVDWAGFGRAEVLIEAVFEDLALKQKLLAEFEALSRVDGIFATNTSAIPIAEIAAQARHPERVIGMHFFSPVEKMPLVEIIVTDQTAPEVTATTVAVARKMGKHVIVVKDCAGFYTTRALVPYMSEAIFMALDGYSLLDIDEAATRVGFPVGPITLSDEVGIDVGVKVLKTIRQYYGERMQLPPDVSGKLLEEGRYGRKNNKGFYKYKNGKSELDNDGRKIIDDTVYKHLPGGKGSKHADFAEMGDRLVLGLVNEAALCLQEGILRDAYAGDLGAVMGIGFPPFEGGPFRYVDRFGARAIVDRLRALESKYGKRFTPCALLVDLAAKGGKFYG